MITFGSVCSGIEAASVAWHPLGWRAEWLAEIEKFPSEVLKHHYPEVPNLGDMTKIADKVKAGEVAAPDVLVGGTPCQAFSVAGMREGLADPRGELTIRYVELADAIDDVRRKRGEQPAIIVWENVPGVLSSKDNAFGCFLGALAGEDGELQPAGKKWGNAGCVYGPKRAIAWRVLDAQYFGLAQRRNRVFLVASSRDGFDPAKILFEFDSVRRDSAPSREAGKEVAGNASTSSGESSPVVGALCARDFKGVGNQYVSEGKLIIERPYQDVSHCLNAVGIGSSNQELFSQRGSGMIATPYRMVAFGEYADDDSASTMKARDYKDATDLVCVHGTQDPIISMDRAHALGRNNGQENAVLSFAQNSRDEVRLVGGDGQISGALSANPGIKQTTYIAHSYGIPGNWIGRKPENGGNAVEPMRDISPCLTSTDRHGVLPINTMTVQGRPSDDLNPRMGSGIGSPGDPQNTLTKAHMHGVFDPEIMRVRRLTPVECERMQGFPEIVKTCTITVFPHRDSNVCFSDQPSTLVLAALKSHKSPSNASPAEENVFPSNANAAEQHLSASQAGSSVPVLVSAQIDLERQHLHLHSQGKLLLSVSIADASEWCHLNIQAVDFVRLSVALLECLEKIAPTGKEESRQSTDYSTRLLNGRLSANQSGQEIEELASDAEKFIAAVKKCTTFITSGTGRNSQNFDSILQTLLCCVTTAISSFIPCETRIASSYALSIEVSHGYTQIPWKGKPAEECPDGHRYKALGNSMAVPCMAWIGKSIQRFLG